jgi:hypothetical protein
MSDSHKPSKTFSREHDHAGLQPASAAVKSLKVDASDLSDETKRLLGLLPQLTSSLQAVDQAADDLNHQDFNAHRAAIQNVQAAWVNARLELLQYAAAVANAGQDKDPAATRLRQIQEISAAQTGAYVQELEALQKIQIAWLKAHPAQFSPDEIASAQESNRREIESVKDAAANQSIAQIRDDLFRRQQRQSDYDDAVAAEIGRVYRAVDALAQANRDKRGATDADAGGVLDRKISAAQSEKLAAEAALQRARSAGTANAAAITRERAAVATATGVETAKEAGHQYLDLLNTQAGKMQLTLGQLMVATGKTHEQSEAILKGILDHHLNLINVLNQLAAQFVAQQQQMSVLKQQISNLSTPSGGQ